MELRKPTIEEKKLIEFLVQKSDEEIFQKDLDSLKVKSMDDGDMGSLKLVLDTVSQDNRIFGKAINEYSFDDEDGIKVITTLYLDKDGRLFELDMWKTNYEKVIKIPEL